MLLYPSVVNHEGTNITKTHEDSTRVAGRENRNASQVAQPSGSHSDFLDLSSPLRGAASNSL
jgi:hypothetical protein